MFEELINRVLEKHPDFSYEEVNEICEDFWSEIPIKIKEITKIKRITKFIETEFELNKSEILKESNKEYSLETIPEYLFSWKREIKSSLINIVNLRKNIEQTHLFEDANLKINSTDKVALIWKNGSGKTTILKIIIAQSKFNETWIKDEILDSNNLDWEIILAPGLKIWYLSQDLFWKSEKNTLRQEMNSVYEWLEEKIEKLEKLKENSELWEEIEILNKEILEIDWFRKYKLQNEILRYFGFSDSKMSQNVLSLSGWEQTKVQIAKFLISEVDILILDEPTNHLDIAWIIFLEKFCKNWKKALISISHDIRFIDTTSDRIAEVSEKKIHNYPWNYEEYLIEKEVRFNTLMNNYTNQKKELDRQNAYIDRFRANSAKATSVQSRIKAMAKIEILTEPEKETVWKMISINSDKRLPEIIMKIKNLKVWYNEVIASLPEYLEVNKSDKIWIIWENGCWKTTFLKTILNEIPALWWESIINESIKVWSYSQVLEDLDKENNIIEELWKDYQNEKEIRTILWGLLITWDKVEQKISTLSWWERAKVALTKMLLTKPNIIIMDEPTNHLDIHSKEVIKKMLDWFNWTTLVVSHDRDLLESISNKVWLIKDKKLTEFREPEEWFAQIFWD